MATQEKMKAYFEQLLDRQVIKCVYCKKIIGFKLLKSAKSRLFRKPLIEFQNFFTEEYQYVGKNRCCVDCYNCVKEQ